MGTLNGSYGTGYTGLLFEWKMYEQINTVQASAGSGNTGLSPTAGRTAHPPHSN